MPINTNTLGNYLDAYTYNKILEDALARVPDTIDKREGSIIFDALAPSCYQLALYYQELKNVLLNTYVLTANGDYLDNRVAEQGLTRYAATAAVKKAVFKDLSNNAMIIPIGTRFSIISDTENLIYSVTSKYMVDDVIVPGSYNLTCETLGTIGNDYTGNILPIGYVQGLGTAVMSDLLIPARDEETDDELRERYILYVQKKPFGGNIAQYRQELLNISGIGAVQVFPTWDGGGTVKCLIIDSELNIVTNDFINTVQNLIDPENGSSENGLGLGLAPIGHKVTISTPSEVEIDVETTLTLASGVDITSLQEPIEALIEDYLLELRNNWGVSSDLNVYSLGVFKARIEAAILSLPNNVVLNVTTTLINGVASDLILTENSTLSQLPILGAVTLHDSV